MSAATAPRARWYMGELISPASPNSSGMRWQVYMGGTFHRADTLAGIKEIIRDAKAA